MMLLGYVVLVRWFGGGGTISFASPSDAWVCSTGLVVWWWCYCIFCFSLILLGSIILVRWFGGSNTVSFASS